MDELEKTAKTSEAEEIKTETEQAVEDADNGSEAEFSDGAEGESEKSEGKEETPKKPDGESESKPWKTEKNAEQAAKRREAERQAEVIKARTEAIIEALNGVNPFTNEKIEDEADVAEYLTMKEIEKSGKDPVTDYSRFLKNKSKEQERAAQAETSQKEWVRKDREDFSTKHPDVKLDELVGDEMFKTFAVGKVGRVSMIKIYDDYQAFNKLSDERAKTKAAQILANNAANPGKLSNQNPPPAKSVKDMSKSEFEAMVEKVKRGETK
jgi:hypothetical protein